jgi:hypothetical protein
MLYFCCDPRRRQGVLASPLNGIDFLEVLDNDAPDPADRQLILLVHLLKVLGDIALAPEQIQIEGGDRIRNIQVTQVTSFADSTVVQVRVDRWGDFSPYRLRFVGGVADDLPPAWIDPILSVVQFSFKVECPSEFDCRTDRTCPPALVSPPDINYLAKDYASFRQLMLDRLSVTLPHWQERNPADLGITLVELLAYVGDYLSYQQDAVTTEAYLHKARRRTSVRRHARLVDYFMHNGCNARTWVQIQVNADNVIVPAKTPLLTRVARQPSLIPPNSSALAEALRQGAIVFETMEEAVLFQAHSEPIRFYTWGSQECCLPKGATRATLRNDGNTSLALAVGMVLVFQEVLSPKTGEPQDADPAHRWAVRLTEVSSQSDPIGGQFANPPNPDPVPLIEIAWDEADALPFALCISSRATSTQEGTYLEDVTIALGNIVLADHGRTLPPEDLEPVPAPHLFRVPVTAGDRCEPVPPKLIAPRYRPVLQNPNVTQAAPYKTQPPAPDTGKPAVDAMQWDIQTVLPAIELTLEDNTPAWTPQRDLLNSSATAREFVAEIEADGFATLRFGDNQNGQRPGGGEQFTAIYRVGNGLEGNIGADTIAHIVSDLGAITQVRNPLPAVGGLEPETIEQVCQQAPFAFSIQQRAVTAKDYAAVAERHPEVQKALATFCWTGSWRTVFVTIDRKGGLPVDEAFRTEIRAFLERFRMAGYDLNVDAPRFVSLEMEMRVCVKPNYFRSQVKAAVLEVFSNRVLPDGRLGVFHPDNFTFGQTVYLSPLYAAAQSIAGVASVQITRFHRQGTPSPIALKTGKLTLSRLEIARLDNDPNFQKWGILHLIMQGGK